MRPKEEDLQRRGRNVARKVVKRKKKGASMLRTKKQTSRLRPHPNAKKKIISMNTLLEQKEEWE